MSSCARAKDLPYEALITLEIESAQLFFCEISRSAGFSHRSHQFSRLPPLSRRNSMKTEIHNTEPVLQPPVADPTRRGPTIFHPTNFQKTNTGRVDRPPDRELSRFEDVAVWKRTSM